MFIYGVLATDILWHACHTSGNMSRRSGKLGNRIRNLRMDKGLTQLELTYKARLDVTTVNCVENGVQTPTLETLKKLGKVLGLKNLEL